MISVWRSVTFSLDCYVPGLKRKCPPNPWVGLVYFASCVPQATAPTVPSRAQPRKHGVVDIATPVGLEMNLGEKQPQELHYSGL